MRGLQFLAIQLFKTGISKTRAPYQSIAIADCHFILVPFCRQELANVMAVVNFIMEFRGAITAYLDLKIRREKLIVDRDIQVEILAKSGEFEKDGLFKTALATDISLATTVAIS